MNNIATFYIIHSVLVYQGRNSATKTVIQMAKDAGGYITSKQVTRAGMQRRLLSEAVKAGELVHADRGLYLLPGTWEDEYLAAWLRFPKGVFSHGTALSLLGMTNRTPIRLCMTFPRGYNTSCASTAGIECKTVKSELASLGLGTAKTPYGNEIPCYNAERSLCDMLRGQASPDVQVLNPAMKAYLDSKDRDINKLLGYAAELGVQGKVRNYVEVLL